MALTFASRRVDTITVVTCAGRIIEGETAALQRYLDGVLRLDPQLVLHVGGVEFIDSSGLGFLARYVMRTRSAGGSVKLCAVPPHVTEVLRVTRLGTIFECHASEAEAIAAFYQRAPSSAASSLLNTDILCVETSADVLAYVGEMLRQAGYAVTTAANLPDALTLLKAAQPKVVVMGDALRAAAGTQTAENFNALAAATPAVVLPADFSRQEAGKAGDWLLSQVRTLLGEGSGKSKPGVR
jgi:anti-sigma B factor antagonist